MTVHRKEWTLNDTNIVVPTEFIRNRLQPSSVIDYQGQRVGVYRRISYNIIKPLILSAYTLGDHVFAYLQFFQEMFESNTPCKINSVYIPVS